jgi:hypothetical protein
MRSVYRILLVAAVFSAACSSDSSMTAVHAVDHDAEGSWSQNTNGTVIPGNSFLMALGESNGIIVGTGTFAGEAGPYGALAVSGSVTHDSLRLAIVYVANPGVFPQLRPDTAQFVGVLTTRDRINGTLTRRGVANAFGMTRLSVGDKP